MNNSEQKNIIEVAGKLGECLSEYEPQINNNSVNYYIAGSLAQMLYANAEKIEYCNIQDGKIEEIDNEVKVPESAREKLLLTGRKIGDLDIIRLNQYVWGQNKRDVIHNASLIQGIDTIDRDKKSQGILDIIYCSDSQGDLDNTVTNDRVCKLTTINGKNVYVASPETIIAQKLDKTLKCYGTEFEEKKDIKDLVTFINGIYQCYDEEELSKRVSDAWKENMSSIPVSKQNMQVMKKRFVKMRKEIEASDEMGNKDISLDNVFRIMAKSIITYSIPQNSVDINNDTKKAEGQEGTLQAEDDRSAITESKKADIRKQMEWFYKGQTMLTVQDINEYCTEYGLDFNYEMGQARDRVELRTELDQADLSSSDKKSSLMMELSSKAESLGLDIETEIEESTQRNLLRKEMRDFSVGKSEMSIDEINNRCNSLGLNFNYEMENAKVLPIAADTKKCAKNIATGTLARDVRVGSSEIKQNYNELVNPVRATEDKSIDE